MDKDDGLNEVRRDVLYFSSFVKWVVYRNVYKLFYEELNKPALYETIIQRQQKTNYVLHADGN